MAWSSVGFDGTITEIQWAGMAGLLGNDYVAAGNGDCLVTAVPGARSVSVAAGSLYGDGVLSTNSGAETVAMTTPVNGQWYVIALRRTWATNSAALVAIAGATTTTTTPTAPPTSFPTLNTNKGVLTDQPIAWAWCNSANTTVVVYDIRLMPVKSLPPVVANGTERDAKFMTPTQGLQVWRNDLGAVETYYGLYNASTNPGGRDTAGWYIENRQTGLVPIRPTTAVITGGSGSANSLGVVSFSGSTAVWLKGVFSSKFKKYKIIIEGTRGGGVGNYYGYMRIGDDNTLQTSNYGGGFNGIESGYTAATNLADSAAVLTGYVANNNTDFVTEMIISSPALPITTTFMQQTKGFSPANADSYSYGGSRHIVQSAYSSVNFTISGGNITGTIQVFGITDK